MKSLTHSNPQDQKLIYEFEKEMSFDIRIIERKSNSYKSPKTLLTSPAIIVSRISTMFHPKNPFELCDRFILLLQQKQAGKISHLIKEKLFGIVDKILEYKSISSELHKSLLVK